YDYRDWTANHVWLHKPPLTLWLIASGLRAFGMTERAARLPSVAVSSLAILFTFAIGRRLFNTNTGLLAAAFHAVNGLLVELVSARAPTDHVDALLIVLIELAVFLAIQQRDRNGLLTSAAAGLVLGLAVLTKWYPALLILPLWLYVETTRQPIRKAL